MRWSCAAALTVASVYLPQLAALPGTPLLGHDDSLATFWSLFPVVPGALAADLLHADWGEWFAIAVTGTLALLCGLTIATQVSSPRLRITTLAIVAILSAFNAIGFGHALRT
jgi:hypothetical protein